MTERLVSGGSVAIIVAIAAAATGGEPEGVIFGYGLALFVAFWALLAVVVVRPREPFVSAFVVVAFAGIALAGVLASTRVMEDVPARSGVEAGFGYPVHFLYVTVQPHERFSQGEMSWSPWESAWRLDLSRFVLAYGLVVVPLLSAYAVAIRAARGHGRRRRATEPTIAV